MPDLNPFLLTPTAEPPPPVQFGFDVMLAVRMIGDGGAVLLDTTDDPVSVVELLSHCDAADLAPVIETWALPWLLKQRGVGDE